MNPEASCNSAREASDKTNRVQSKSNENMMEHTGACGYSRSSKDKCTCPSGLFPSVPSKFHSHHLLHARHSTRHSLHLRVFTPLRNAQTKTGQLPSSQLPSVLFRNSPRNASSQGTQSRESQSRKGAALCSPWCCRRCERRRS